MWRAQTFHKAAMPWPSAAALLSPCCTLHSHKPKILQEHLSCFQLGTNQVKTGVHQPQVGFISYVGPRHVLGKEKVSLHARSRGGNAACLTMQQGGKATHLGEMHCSLERALLFVCLSPSESHLHTSRSFLTLPLSNFVPRQCSNSVANLSWQRQIHLCGGQVLHHHLLTRLSDPQADPTRRSHSHPSALSGPLGLSHITFVCPNKPPGSNEGGHHLQFPGNSL